VLLEAVGVHGLVVFEDGEVGLLEAVDGLAFGVGDGDIDDGEGDAGLDGVRGLAGGRGGGLDGILSDWVLDGGLDGGLGGSGEGEAGGCGGQDCGGSGWGTAGEAGHRDGDLRAT
jgi:hypothetical protein